MESGHHILQHSYWRLTHFTMRQNNHQIYQPTISIDTTSTTLKLFVLHLLIHQWHRQANSIDNKQCINSPLKSPSQVQRYYTTLTTTLMKSTSQSIDNNHIYTLINEIDQAIYRYQSFSFSHQRNRPSQFSISLQPFHKTTLKIHSPQ